MWLLQVLPEAQGVLGNRKEDLRSLLRVDGLHYLKSKDDVKLKDLKWDLNQ